MKSVKNSDKLQSFDEVLPDFARNVKKRRTCLMCGKIFVSAGSYNRRCRACNRSLDRGKADNVRNPLFYKALSNKTFNAAELEVYTLNQN